MTIRTNNNSPTLKIDNYPSVFSPSHLHSPGACSYMSETPSFQSDDFESLDNFETTLENTNNYVSAKTSVSILF